MIRICVPTDPAVTSLLAQLSEHFRQTYGATDVTAADLDAAAVAFDSGKPVALVGWLGIDEETVHLRRLYVEPAARGRGLTMGLVQAALDYARSAGYRRAVWDTGAELPEVLATSAHLGASEVSPFGAHKESPLTRCFVLALDARTALLAPQPTTPQPKGTI